MNARRIEMQPIQLLALLVPLGIVVVLLPVVLLVVRAHSDPKTITVSIEESELPKRLQRKIQEFGNQPQSAGFRVTGDRKTTRRGIAIYSRSYISDDKRTILEVESQKMCGINVGKTESAMTSVLDEGTVLQSTSLAKTPEAVASLFRDAELGRPRLIVNPTGQESVKPFFDQHQSFLTQKVDEFNAESLTLTPELIPTISKYSMDILDHYMHRQGLLATSPFGSEGEEGEQDSSLKQVLDAVGAALV